MSIVLPALAVAFAAFCVWLAVRAYNRRERWAKRTLAVGLVAFVVGYPLSFGPACWITSRHLKNGEWISTVYSPVIWVWNNCDDPISDAIGEYSFLAASPDWAWEIDATGRITNFVPR